CWGWGGGGESRGWCGLRKRGAGGGAGYARPGRRSAEPARRQLPRLEPLRLPVDQQIRRDRPQDRTGLDPAAALPGEPEEARPPRVLAHDRDSIRRERPETRPLSPQSLRDEARSERPEALQTRGHCHVV